MRADRERHLAVSDPDGRMLTISCGAALHHARVALAAAGYPTETTRFPVTAEPDLIAASGDGVPASAAVRRVPRRVPVRDYAPAGCRAWRPGTGTDRGAAYLVLFGSGDTSAAWPRAGEALSTLLLTSALAGLSAAPLSDTIEVAWPRQLMRDLLSGAGEPFLIVRLGFGPVPADLPPVPRRSPDQAIEMVG